MLDIKYLRENLEEAEKRLNSRGGSVDLSRISSLDDRRRALIIEGEALKARRNTASHEIGRLKKEKQDSASLMAEMQEVSARIKEIDAQSAEGETELQDFLLTLPNLPHPSVSLGREEPENPVIRSWGKAREFDFDPAEHTEIGERLGIIDFERAGRLSGARFSLLKGAGGGLERALINFMLDLHTLEHGYTEEAPPFM